SDSKVSVRYSTLGVVWFLSRFQFPEEETKIAAWFPVSFPFVSSFHTYMRETGNEGSISPRATRDGFRRCRSCHGSPAPSIASRLSDWTAPMTSGAHPRDWR